MIKLKLITLVGFLFFSVNCFAAAFPQQEKIIGSTAIEAGDSTENVMPLLLEIVRKKGDSLKKVYGHIRLGYIVIAARSMGNINNAEGMGKDIFTIITSYYPLAEGEVTLMGDKSDLWDYVRLDFKNKKITKFNIEPEKEEINKRNVARNNDVDTKFGLTVDQREHFCHEQGKIYDIAEDIAVSKYGKPISGEKAELWLKLHNQVFREEEEKLFKKYGVTEEQAKEIYSEGHKKGWF
ncbi:MAG: hypothetical protein KJ893_00075 [Candidatus Omnitrophica bacterium]|nr:hypothetical protein [Candidatus Omnitrophota bacterium]